MAETHSCQYRVWDVEQEKFFDKWVFLGTDGFLYDCGIDDGPSLLRPDWFVQERVIQGGKFYRWSGMKVDTYIIDHQHEWYIVEFATGYMDIAKKMIFQGDIVKADWHWTKPYAIKWPGDQYDFSEYSLDSANVEVIGNIHETPELQKE